MEGIVIFIASILESWSYAAEDDSEYDEDYYDDPEHLKNFMGMNMSDKKIALVTGASSGIGLEVAMKLQSLGYKVYGAARRTELLEPLEKSGGARLYLDLTDSKSITDCVKTVIEKEGTVHVLVNNAGYGLGGALETVSIEEARRQFDVNLFGLAEITRLVLPYMRNQNSGRIINVSSIAGKFSSPFLGWYHATKYAVEAYSDSLRQEVAPFGIKVSIIEPGMIQTDWGIIAEKSITDHSIGTAYEEKGRVVGDFYRNIYGKNNATPVSVISRLIVKSVITKNPAPRYRAGKMSFITPLAVRLLSTRMLDFILARVYR